MSRSLRGVLLLGLLAALGGSACGDDAAEPPQGAARPRGGTSAASAGTLAVPAAGPGAAAGARCSVGSSSCYCPDGTASGAQTCDARRELSACQCSVTVGSSNSGVQSDPTAVCAELQGMTGCDARSYASPRLPSSMLFVVDRSGSMACNAPPVQTVAACNQDPKRADPAQPSRWEITIKALEDAFGGLMGSNAAIGLSMFSTDGFCGVDSTPVVGLDAVTPGHLASLAGAMRDATPAGGTPIVGAVIQGYHHLHEELRAAGNRYVVLITDGEESCGTKGREDDAADLSAAQQRLLQAEVKKARDANIRTFVIGSPGSEGARGFLSELAFLGGTARASNCQHGNPEGEVGDCHFDLSNEADFAAVLQKTLGEVSGQAVSCEYRTPPNSGTANVQVSRGGAKPSCVPQATGACASSPSGWQFSKLVDGSSDYSRIELCGSTCAAVKDDHTSVVDVILGCPVLL
jgi:hypothetical protein